MKGMSTYNKNLYCIEMNVTSSSGKFSWNQYFVLLLHNYCRICDSHRIHLRCSSQSFIPSFCEDWLSVLLSSHHYEKKINTYTLIIDSIILCASSSENHKTQEFNENDSKAHFVILHFRQFYPKISSAWKMYLKCLNESATQFVLDDANSTVQCSEIIYTYQNSTHQ